MTKRIIYMRPDGGMSIVTPCISTDDPEGFLEQHAIERVLAKDIPADAIDVQIINHTDLPADATFRNAWKHSNGIIDHDMTKARDILRMHIRRQRASILSSLDVAYQRADEASDTSKKQVIAQQKQALRDLPAHPSIEAAETIEDLKAAWPSELEKPEGF